MRLVGLLAALALGGCDRCSANDSAPAIAQSASAAPPPIGAPPEGTRALTAAEADRLLAPGAPRPVELSAPGDEPRQLLRHADGTSRYRLDVVLESEAGPEGAAAAVTEAPLRFEAMVELRADGTLHFHDTAVTALAVPTDPEVIARTALATRGLTLAPAKLACDPLARTLSLEPAPGLSREAFQIWGGFAAALRELLPPLPSEPIGIGAEWRSLERRREAGGELLIWNEHTLEAIAPPTIRTLSRAVAAQPATRDPGLPPDVDLTIVAGSAGGRSQLRLGRGRLPDWAELQHTTRLSLSMRFRDNGSGAELALASTHRTRTEWRLGEQGK